MQDLNDYFKVRKDLYLFLAKIFYKEASLDYIENFKKRIPVLEAIADVAKKSQLKEFCKTLNNILAKIAQDDINALECVFANLFLGIGSSKGVPSISPCESVYLSPKKMVMQQERDEVLKVYCQQGMGVGEDFKEPEDHVTAEMGFLAMLSDKTYSYIEDKEYEKADELVKVQHEFLKSHLTKWAVALSDDMVKYSSADYYKVAGKVVVNFILADYQLLESIMSDELEEEASGK